MKGEGKRWSRTFRGRPAASVLLIALGGGLTGCGPSSVEVGAAVLMACPFVLLTITIVHWALARLWSRLRPELAWSPRILLVVLLLLGAVAGLVAARAPVADLSGMATAAYLFFGGVCLPVDLAIWRSLLRRQGARAFTIAPLGAIALTAWPAPWLLYLGRNEDNLLLDIALTMYVTGAMFGIPAALALCAAFGEVAVRRVRARRSQRT